jgi:hypothetical protein
MYNDSKKFTRLTLEQNDLKLVWEVPYGDVNGEDMMHTIHTLMIGMSFCDKAVFNSMVSFLMEHAGHLFEITEKNDECYEK